MNFVTTRKEALDAMERYIENNISDYTAKRNFDFIHMSIWRVHYQINLMGIVI